MTAIFKFTFLEEGELHFIATPHFLLHLPGGMILVHVVHAGAAGSSYFCGGKTRSEGVSRGVSEGACCKSCGPADPRFELLA